MSGSQTGARNLKTLKPCKLENFYTLKMILGTCWTTFVFMSLLKSDICQMSRVKCQMLMLILGTCWTTFVFMSMLKSDLFAMSSVKCQISNAHVDPRVILNNVSHLHLHYSHSDAYHINFSINDVAHRYTCATLAGEWNFRLLTSIYIPSPSSDVGQGVSQYQEMPILAEVSSSRNPA